MQWVIDTSSRDKYQNTFCNGRTFFRKTPQIIWQGFSTFSLVGIDIKYYKRSGSVTTCTVLRVFVSESEEGREVNNAAANTIRYAIAINFFQCANECFVCCPRGQPAPACSCFFADLAKLHAPYHHEGQLVFCLPFP